MTPLETATNIVESCLKDSQVTSAVRMRLAGEIAEKLRVADMMGYARGYKVGVAAEKIENAGLVAEKLRERFKAGMMRAAARCWQEHEGYELGPKEKDPYIEGYHAGCTDCENAIRAESEKEEG